MLRDPKDSNIFGLKTINCLIADNGIGDMLAAYPAINYITTNCPWINLLVWVPDYMLDLAKNTLKGVIIRGYSEAPKKYDDKRTGITTKWDGRISPMRIHPVDYAFLTLTDSIPEMDHKNYPKVDTEAVDLNKFDLPTKYVIIQATATEKVKSMPIETANDISKYVVSKGYTPVYLGKTLAKSGHDKGDKKAHDLGIDKSLGIDLVDNTTLLESITIISKAKCFVGTDGGLMHMAGFTDIPLCVGYTFISPKNNLPIRNNQVGWNCYTVVPDVSCKFCQSNIKLCYGFDYRDCFYKDYKCVSQMTPDKFIAHLEGIL